MDKDLVFSQTYIEKVILYKDKINFKFMVIINNKTLKKSYSILSNMYCDPFYITERYMSTGNFNKNALKKLSLN